MQFVVRLLRRVGVIARSHVALMAYFGAVVIALFIGPLIGIEMLGVIVAVVGGFVVWLIGPYNDDIF